MHFRKLAISYYDAKIYVTYDNTVMKVEQIIQTRRGSTSECTIKEHADTSIESHWDVSLKGLSTGPKNLTEKGKRLKVLHRGSSEGFAKEHLMCFGSKKKIHVTTLSPWHKEWRFVFWMVQWDFSILRLLNDNAIIVMGNASYQSVKKDPIGTHYGLEEELHYWMVEIKKCCCRYTDG